MSIIRNAANKAAVDKGLAGGSAEDFVRQQVGIDPQRDYANAVGTAMQGLRGNASPQGLAEMGVNPQAIQEAMKMINAQDLALTNQRQAQTGAITIPEQGLAAGALRIP